jgi:hypothetical protein
MDLDTVADQLYGLSPDEFAPTRKRLASEAQTAGNRELASAIRQLRRPTTSAWLANLLVRERPTEITTLLDLGAALHKAQSELAGTEIRRLSQQRQEIVASLSEAARDLARDVGKEVSDSIVRELEETLDAAIVNPEAREAFAAGHLAVAMRYSGLGSVELSGVVTSGPKGTKTGSARAGRKDRGNAAEAIREAEALVANAEREAAGHFRQRQNAQAEVDRCHRAVAETEGLLRARRNERQLAQVELRKADRALSASQRRVTDARRKEAAAHTAAATAPDSTPDR